MLGKAFSIALIILGLYILGSFIANLGKQRGESHSNTQSYHIGCYQTENPLNQSQRIQQYLTNLTDSLSPYSVEEVRKAQGYADKLKVNTNGANQIALEFKKYIMALQKIKNLNEYQQSYDKGIREARDDFVTCRDKFREEQWDCKGSYGRYLESDDNFTIIKGHLINLIGKKFDEQRQVEKLLQPNGYNDGENQTYYKLLEQLNGQLSANWELIKGFNQSLINLENREFRESHELNVAVRQLDECKKNMNQILVCQKITEEIKKIDYGLVPHDIQVRINGKRAIIERYESALAKSIKVGSDTTQIRAKLAQNQNQLNLLIDLYGDAETQSQCADQIIFKCSQQQIAVLQKNITSLQLSLNNTQILKHQIIKNIDLIKKVIQEINQKKAKAAQDYQNAIGSLDKIKELQAANLEKLKEHRDTINQYNKNITEMKALFGEAEKHRWDTIHDLDSILKRVGELTVCLAKKDYLLQLQSKRPQKREEDIKKKRKAAERLIQTIGTSYK